MDQQASLNQIYLVFFDFWRWHLQIFPFQKISKSGGLAQLSVFIPMDLLFLFLSSIIISIHLSPERSLPNRYRDNRANKQWQIF
jgi:hypothetical protein